MSRLRRKLFHLFFLLKRPMTLGVRAIVEDEKGQVLLVRHTYVPGWHLPGGGVETGQSFLQALADELREEANVELSGKARLLGIYFNKQASKRDHVAVFHCTRWKVTTPKIPDREIAETGWFSMDKLPEGTTQATRRRLSELQEGQQPDEFW